MFSKRHSRLGFKSAYKVNIIYNQNCPRSFLIVHKRIGVSCLRYNTDGGSLNVRLDCCLVEHEVIGLLLIVM